ncbi:MAG: methyltransferase domain-containing protein [Thermodesulfobacteriota bacterium]
MRIIPSHYLSDGKGFNDGRAVELIQIEGDKDYETLLQNIIRTDYYDNAYFQEHIHYQEDRVKFDAFHLTALLRVLKPKRLLELGCGRGDVLFLLGLDKKTEVRGIEYSRDILSKIWPDLTGKVDCGDVQEVCTSLLSDNEKYDTFCAFDFWEHLLPRRLDDYIDALVALAEKDAFFFFTIPAFGEDRVFGEIFPLEVEENRYNFDSRLPFSYLNAESIDPIIPAQGHLVWAHSEWWQTQFERHGLVRAEDLERELHQYFDEHLFYARRSFFLFHLDRPEGRRRLKKLSTSGLSYYKKWKLFMGLQETIHSYKEGGKDPCIDINELQSTLHHAEFFMVLDVKKQIEQRIWGPTGSRRNIRWARPFLARLENRACQCFEIFRDKYKKRKGR